MVMSSCIVLRARLHPLVGDRGDRVEFANVQLLEMRWLDLQMDGAIESIYQKLSDRASSVRMEALEWVVIILIAIEIVLGFVR
jgi:hypothetical protein